MNIPLRLASIALVVGFTLSGCLAVPKQQPSSTGSTTSAQAEPAATSAEPTAQETQGGLKDAILQGVQAAITRLGQKDGFNNDQLVHIKIPRELKGATEILGRFGMGGQVEQFELTLNRAAEQAVPEASAIFVEAVRKMTWQDAVRLLAEENETAVTDYFKEKTQAQLGEKFLPLVQNSTEKTGVTQAYKKLSRSLPSTLAGQAPDLDAYVTAEALDGLFTYIAVEEKKIRENPAERTTDLLEKVFGYYLNL